MSLGALRIGTLCLVACMAAGCTARVNTPTTLKTIKVENKNSAAADSGIPMNTDGFFAGDMDAENTISTECVAAWRKELKGDTEGAMKQLEELNAKFPKMTTIAMMQGQVLSHAGRKEEAVKYFRDAVRGSEFSSLHQFKLAEALSKTGKSKEAADAYRKVLDKAPDFVPAKVGLARALFQQDKSSKEAAELLDDVLAKFPDNKEAAQLKTELAAGK